MSRAQICVLLTFATSLANVHGLDTPLDLLLVSDSLLDRDLALDDDADGHCVDLHKFVANRNSFTRKIYRALVMGAFGTMNPCCH